jgi:hypothetical protein
VGGIGGCVGCERAGAAASIARMTQAAGKVCRSIIKIL